MGGWVEALIGAGGSMISGSMNANASSNNAALAAGSNVAASQGNASLAYPGQKKLGERISSYLWANINEGLSDKEKRLMSSTGKDAIFSGLKTGKESILKTASSQGLRGGTIADALNKSLTEGAIPQLTNLSNKISETDFGLKRKNVDDIIKFLSTKMGWNENQLMYNMDRQLDMSERESGKQGFLGALLSKIF